MTDLRKIALVLSTFWAAGLLGQNPIPGELPVFSQGDSAWVEARLGSLTLDEKLGQLFMVAAYSNKGEAHRKEIARLIQKENIGGLIFFQGGPARQARLTNLYQQQSKIPLMIGMDAEWGLAMRLDSTFKFPWPLTLGATRDSLLAYRLGREMARHCKRLGVHVNFAPVVDLNTNADNPIINARSLGEDPQPVGWLAAAFQAGMHGEKVLACAKHFPGHGDTDSDSHKTLPTVGHSRSRLDSVELAPYRYLLPRGLSAVMAAHLNVPALDPSGTPSSLSPTVIQDFLRQSLGFQGLIFTDALNMRGVADLYPPGEVDWQALRAGNDVLLFSQDVAAAKARIKKALQDGEITDSVIDEHVRRILLAKSWLGLKQKRHVEPRGIYADLNPMSSEILNRQIYAGAVTALLNRNKIIPLKELKDKKIAVVTAGTETGEEFARIAGKYVPVDVFSYQRQTTNELLNQLSGYDLVLTAIYTSNASPWKSYRIAGDIRSFVNRLTLQNKTLLALFANPYALRNFPEARQADALLVAYQNHPAAESVTAQVIFGALGAQGRLPVSGSDVFQSGFGLDTENLNRLGYGLPGEVNLDPNELRKIDILAQEAIRKKATPGCQILIARHGKVVYEKSFGHHSYDLSQPVTDADIYDLASITKIAATLPLLMKLVEDGRVDLDESIGRYLPELKGTNKEDLEIREILAHQARLQPWIPFYLEAMDKGRYRPGYFSQQRSFDYPHQVAQQLYSSRHMRDTLEKRIIDSDLRPKKEYKYSDLGFYLLYMMVEEMLGGSLDELADEMLYSRLGAHTMTFHPLRKFPPGRIVPTENDLSFRKQLLRGHVHDQGSAMLGGVAGHAGLFSNANDLAKLMQMYLNGGTYGGVRYLDSITLREFTRCQYCDDDNRRGIGFDKPQLSGEGPTCGCLSPLSYGHTGFTGTIAWADPNEDLIYIFLSNRIHPHADNRELLSLSTRTRIQKLIYHALNDEGDTSPVISDLKP